MAELKKGTLQFNNNQVLYQTLVSFSGEPYCLRGICYDQMNGYKVISINLTNSFVFSQNFTIIEGSYLLTFVNQKNESKINVYFE